MTDTRECITAKPLDAIPASALVAEVHPLTGDTSHYRLHLEDMRLSGGFDFMPGQFVQLSVPAGGEVPISLVGESRGDGSIELCIRKAGHVTEMVHRLTPGARVGIRGPFGNGFPVDRWTGRNVLLLAGGLGIAPLHSLLHYLLQNRSHYADITLMYGARKPAALLFRDELRQLSCRGDFRLLLTVDFVNGQPPQELQCRTGLLTELLVNTPIPTGNTVAAVCGPPAIYRCLVGELHDAGIGASDIYLSLERRMKCGTGLCCHCAVGDLFCCTDGPVFRYADVRHVAGVL